MQKPVVTKFYMTENRPTNESLVFVVQSLSKGVEIESGEPSGKGRFDERTRGPGVSTVG